MRCVSLCVRGEWFRVPCGGPSASVRSLGSEALLRYQRAKPLEDGDMEAETWSSACGGFSVESCFTLRTEQRTQKPYQEPKEYIQLDGNSLTTAALVDLGQGLFKIKLAPEAEEKAIKCRELIDAVIREGTASCLSWVPEKGTVGASGDLAPLAHLTLGLMGEGRMWSPRSGWAEAKAVLEGHGLKPVVLKPKEGIALINGTQLITSLGAEAVERSLAAARQADIIAALSLEALKGTTRAFHSALHAVRPHPGQMEVAERLRSLLDSQVFPSLISESHRSCSRVQDPYTLRCIPQVHGVVNDTITFVQKVISTELNSATDNPLVFAETREIISGGNFHGEYPAKALDYLAIGVHELASMSERRTERLVNPALSGPAGLPGSGRRSELWIHDRSLHRCCLSVGEQGSVPPVLRGLLVHQRSHRGPRVHGRLGGSQSPEGLLAIELLAACQALEFLRPLKTTAPLEGVHQLLRSVVSPWDRDRVMSPDIEAAHTLIRQQKLWKTVQPFMEEYRKKLSTR
ncbi:hypothetical protein KUCAC02_020465 [Chaenocephalus aceratus]|nr:hypothetical protein KUCAC02_020465 [Chaenocephalus aceratus]